MENMKLSKLIDEDKLQSRIREMGSAITDKLKGKDIVALGVLKGSFMFYADLVRSIDLDLSCDFLGVSSYVGMSSSGECKLTLDVNSRLKNKHVILVEDIVDTGITLNFLKNHIEQRQPASITTVALLHKPEALKVECDIDMIGFEIANDFVVGYGLDYQGLFRNLPYIAQVQNIN